MNNGINNAQWKNNRNIAERIIIKGDLILETPAYFGGGENDSLVDVPLFLDPLEGKALLTGTSIAGALRNYLREREHGYEKVGNKTSYYMQLFGRQLDKEGEQSLVIVHDSLSNISGKELRDGVRIDPKSRTAQDKNKFDFELLEAGTSFQIVVELLVQEYLFSWNEIPGNDSRRFTDLLKSNYDVDWVKTAKIDKTNNDKTIMITSGKNYLSLNINNENTELDLKIDNGTTEKFIVKTENGKLNIYKKREELLKGLALALKGFEKEEIPLGMRKNRGFGRCKVSKWEVCRYNLTDPKELVDWINNTKKFKEVTKIADMLGEEFDLDNRNIFKLKANFSLEGSLLIRSSPLDLKSPDSVHLRSKRKGQKEKVPILSGTSLAGALRSRAQRIARTIDRNGKAKALIDSLFGPDIESLCLFCWDDIPETGNAQLIESLTRNYFAHINNAHINKNSKIEKSKDTKTIEISHEKNSIKLQIYPEKGKVDMIINSFTKYELIVRIENGKTMIYSHDTAHSSRIVTSETEIKNAVDMVQNRIKIDRFTGGAYPSALFNEQPVFGKKGTNIEINLMIKEPDNAQIGLLLLLLKDLWTEDLPLGGESSVGRGRLHGKDATLSYMRANETPKILRIEEIKESNGKLSIKEEDKTLLQGFVNNFWKEIGNNETF